MNKIISYCVTPTEYKPGDIFKNSVDIHYILANGPNGYICIQLRNGSFWNEPTKLLSKATEGLKFVGSDVTIKIER